MSHQKDYFKTKLERKVRKSRELNRGRPAEQKMEACTVCSLCDEVVVPPPFRHRPRAAIRLAPSASHGALSENEGSPNTPHVKLRRTRGRGRRDGRGSHGDLFEKNSQQRGRNSSRATLCRRLRRTVWNSISRGFRTLDVIKITQQGQQGVIIGRAKHACATAMRYAMYESELRFLPPSQYGANVVHRTNSEPN